MPRPREYDDALRTRLLDAAARLLVDEGPAAVTTRRVASEVGTSTTAIYSLIGSKDDLMQAVRREGFTRLAAHLQAVPPTGEPLTDLATLGTAYFQMALDSPDLYRVLFGAAPAQLGIETDAADEEAAAATLLVLVEAVERCVDAGYFPGSATEVATTLWAVGHGYAGLAITGMLGPPDEARAHMLRGFRALARGLNADAVSTGGTPLPTAFVGDASAAGTPARRRTRR